jgi:cholinesterase
LNDRESAGGASIDFYTYAYIQDPIISGAIIESGSVSSFADPQPANNLENWNKASQQLGCHTRTIKESVNCMRGKSMEDILKVTKVSNPLQAVLGIFGPTVDHKVVFGDYEARSKEGKFIQKPYLIGNNDFEAGLFELIGRAGKIQISSNIWSVFNAAVFTCPVAKAAGARAKRVQTWRFRYFGDWPNTNLAPKSGAYHTAEISMIFGTSSTVTFQKDTAEQARVSDFMMRTWASFAKDPMSISKAPFNLPIYKPEAAYSEETLLGFGANNLTRQLLTPGGYDMYCDTIASIVKQIPGGIFGAITNVATGKDLGIPGLKANEIPDMTPLPLPSPPAGVS